MTGSIWLVPQERVPEGAWLLGVAAILLGINVARRLHHIAMSWFSLFLGGMALLAALGRFWRLDIPLLALCFIIIGLSIVVKPLFARAR